MKALLAVLTYQNQYAFKQININFKWIKRREYCDVFSQKAFHELNSCLLSWECKRMECTNNKTRKKKKHDDYCLVLCREAWILVNNLSKVAAWLESDWSCWNRNNQYAGNLKGKKLNHTHAISRIGVTKSWKPIRWGLHL